MTNKIEVPRELLVIANVCVMRSHDLLVEQLKITDHKDEYRAEITRLKDTHDQLVAALAAPEAPRQEPSYYRVVTPRVVVNGEPTEWWPACILYTKKQLDALTEPYKIEERFYAAPLSPDHSGGGAGVVLPERDSAYDPDARNLDESSYAEGWNACLDKVKELNQ